MTIRLNLILKYNLNEITYSNFVFINNMKMY